jgi:hypothetical protein
MLGDVPNELVTSRTGERRRGGIAREPSASWCSSGPRHWAPRAPGRLLRPSAPIPLQPDAPRSHRRMDRNKGAERSSAGLATFQRNRQSIRGIRRMHPRTHSSRLGRRSHCIHDTRGTHRCRPHGSRCRQHIPPRSRDNHGRPMPALTRRSAKCQPRQERRRSRTTVSDSSLPPFACKYRTRVSRILRLPPCYNSPPRPRQPLARGKPLESTRLSSTA